MSEEPLAYTAWLRDQPCELCGSKPSGRLFPVFGRDTKGGEKRSRSLPFCAACLERFLGFDVPLRNQMYPIALRKWLRYSQQLPYAKTDTCPRVEGIR